MPSSPASSTPQTRQAGLRRLIGTVLADDCPSLKWPFAGLLTLAGSIGIIPLLVGRHVALTLAVLAVVGLAKVRFGSSCALLAIFATTASRLVVDLADPCTEWGPETLNLFMDGAAGVALVLLIEYLTGRERERAALEQAVAIERAAERAAREERARVGSMLHDGLAQQLASANIDASLLSRNLARDLCGHAPTALRLSEEVRKMVKLCRQIAHGFLAEVVPGGALTGRLDDLASNTQQEHGLPCLFVLHGPAPTLTDEQATNLFLIAGEAVRNALVHAAPTRVEIVLSHDGKTLTLTVSDDGRGPVAPAKQDPMGRRIMEHRASLIGATYHFGPGRKGGAQVTCVLPLGGPALVT